MRAKAILVVSSFAAVLVVAGVMWRSARSAHAAAASEHATLRAELVAMDAECRLIKERASATEKARDEMHAATAALRRAKPVATSASSAARASSPASPMERIAADPKLQLLYLASRRAEFATAYGPLLQSLALSPAQTESLRAASLAAEEQNQDIAAVMREQGLTADDPGIVAARKRVRDELAAAQLAALGADGVEKLHDYERTMPAREIVGRFAGAAALGDVPVSAQQAERLTQIVAAASQLSPDGVGIDIGSIDWNAADAQAAQVLTADQLALFMRIEPIGGGPSRWMARFSKALSEAKKSAPAGKPPGG